MFSQRAKDLQCHLVVASSFIEVIEALKQVSILEVMIYRRSQLDQALVELASLPEGELELSSLNQLLEDFDLALSCLLLVLLVDSC